MEGSGFGYVFHVGLVGEGRVKDDTQVADHGGWRDGATIHLEKKVSGLPQLRLGAHDHELCLLAVEFEEVGGHPGL